MDPTYNAGGQAQSEPSSMAPMLSIVAEMQRELGDLRRSKERGHGSDSEDGDDGSVSVPLFETRGGEKFAQFEFVFEFANIRRIRILKMTGKFA
jgi:hypothetical protein